MDDNRNITLGEFTQNLAKAIKEDMEMRYGLHVDLEAHKVLKTNVEKEALTVKFDDPKVAPTLYTEKAYRDFLFGIDLKNISSKMADDAYKAYQQSPYIPEITPEEAKKHITLTLVNTRLNQQMLEKTPHMEILGGELSAIPRWYISDDASFVVSNELCGTLGLTPDEVLMIGQQHINSQDFEAKPMQEILLEIMGVDHMDMMPPMDGPQMIVLTSKNKIQGSNALLSEEALEHVHDMIGDYVILPSSIHEVICVPISEDSMQPDELRAMVQEINGTEVAPEERLSDNIMKYDGHKLSLVGESFKMETPTADINMDTQSIKFAM